MKKKVKFCPRCGTQLSIADSYCIRCGYNFKAKHKKLNLMQILIVLLVLCGMWIAIRLILNKPIIPLEIVGFAKGFIKTVTNKTG